MYAMTITGNDIVSRWEPCRAKTLSGAKREATSRFGGGYSHHTILVAEAETDDAERMVVATRPLSSQKWEMCR